MTRKPLGKLRLRRDRKSFIKLRRSLRRKSSITLRLRRKLQILLQNLRSITAKFPRLFRIPKDTDKKTKRLDAVTHLKEMSMNHRVTKSPQSTSPDTIKEDIMDTTVIRQMLKRSTSGATTTTMTTRHTPSSDAQSKEAMLILTRLRIQTSLTLIERRPKTSTALSSKPRKKRKKN